MGKIYGLQSSFFTLMFNTVCCYRNEFLTFTTVQKILTRGLHTSFVVDESAGKR